jgi:integrase
VLFLYREVLKKDLGAVDSIRAKKPKRLPTVLSREEARKVIGCMSGAYQVMAKLLYGSGLRLMECVRLRVKDVDFAQHQIVVRDGKGEQDRITMLPDSLIAPLQEHLQRVKQLHKRDLAQGQGAVYLPYALDRKYPNASHEWREAGNMCFPPTACHKTHALARRAATTWMKVIYKGLSEKPHVWP